MTCGSCGRENDADALFCSACGTQLDARQSDVETRKVVTVVFTDVTGSTALGERLDPESLRRVMRRYFDTMQATLERHGGTVEKFIGDAIVAISASRPSTKTTRFAVRAATNARCPRAAQRESRRTTASASPRAPASTPAR